MSIVYTMLYDIIDKHGPIPSVRVSSAQASGFAKKFNYWGAVRYLIKKSKTKPGYIVNKAQERASSDRRSVQLAIRDAELISLEENRVHIQSIGLLGYTEVTDVLEWLAERETPAQESAQIALVCHKFESKFKELATP